MAELTDANITSFVRGLLDEATTEVWTDDQITLYIQMAMVNVVAKYWYLLAPTEATASAVSLVANTESVTIPTGAAKILRVEVAETRKMLRKIEPDELWKYSVFDDGDAKENYLNVWYLPYYYTTTDFPEAIRPLLAIEAAIYAKTQDESVDNGILALQRDFEATATTFLATDSMYEPTVFGDYDLEDSYTYTDPVAWAFRAGKIYLYKLHDEAD